MLSHSTPFNCFISSAPSAEAYQPNRWGGVNSYVSLTASRDSGSRKILPNEVPVPTLVRYNGLGGQGSCSQGLDERLQRGRKAELRPSAGATSGPLTTAEAFSPRMPADETVGPKPDGGIRRV